VDAMDASIILQSVVDSIDSLPVMPDEPILMASGNMWMEETGAYSGQPLAIPLMLENGQNIYSFQGELNYDHHILTLDPDQPISMSVDQSGFTIKTADDGNGHLKFAAYRSYDSGVSDGVFANINFSSMIIDQGEETLVSIESFKLNSNLYLNLERSIVSTDQEIELPSQYSLKQNYPNPFNPMTTISYGLPEASDVSIIIYDVTGREVANLVQTHKSAGWYDVKWNGLGDSGNLVSTGLYFARIQASGFSDVIKMVYLR
jgi:hypothetical protein